MAKRFETKKVEREEKWCMERTCDSCGAKAAWPDPGHWEAETSYDVSEVRIEHKDGSSFPDSRSVEVTSFDICPTCFETKVVPFMESIGAKPIKSKEDW
jgi:rRNA maturation protein Nop10